VPLIREGNVAAAISFAGALIGFVLPLASAISHSVNLLDMLAWALIALVAQIIVYAVVARIVHHFAQAIEGGRTAPATLLATVAIAVGLLNAAALTY
jgi:putative membrane protein